MELCVSVCVYVW